MMPCPDRQACLQRWQQADDDVLLYVDQTLVMAQDFPPGDPTLWASLCAEDRRAEAEEEDVTDEP